MGLGMYLTGRRYVSGWDHAEPEDKKQFAQLIKLAGMDEPPCPETPSGYIELNFAHWHKANAIHKWFVDNCQDGEDDCREVPVSRDQLQELLDLCKKVLKKAKLKKGKPDEYYKVITNPKEVKKLLPTSEGFFFGSTEYDEAYVSDVKDTITQLEKVLLLDENEWEIFYRSSW